MKFWPSDKFDIETGMSPQAIVSALRPEIAPRKFFRMSSRGAPFQGDITDDGFRMSRIIHYHNSFLPIITGRFLPGTHGTRVEIRLDLHPFVFVFMCVWFTGIGLGVLATITALFIGTTPPSPVLLIPFAMFFFGWGLVSAGFWLEARKQKPMLIEMFQAYGLTTKGHEGI